MNDGRSKQQAKRARADGPKINLRFRTRKELEDVRRAAREKGLSVNTYVLTEVLAQARNYLSYNG
jgi:uncharacterized protein (DUF1778 family)